MQKSKIRVLAERLRSAPEDLESILSQLSELCEPLPPIPEEEEVKQEDDIGIVAEADEGSPMITAEEE